MKLPEEAVFKIRLKLSKARRKASIAWAAARKAWVRHVNMKQEEAKKPSLYKISKQGNQWLQYWDHLPAYCKEYAPNREDPKFIYRNEMKFDFEGILTGHFLFPDVK